MDEDRARIEYECQSCGVHGATSAELAHKPDCKPKVGAVKKVCLKSGKSPHATEAKK